jgi:DNA-binding NarL/FixJ family response regulator
MTVPKPLRVLICDDDAMIHEALCELVGDQPDMQVVGVAADAAQAISLAEHHRPDVIILDMRIPGTGIHAAREIRRLLPSAKIVAFSAYGDQASIMGMKNAGADQYLLKGVRNEEILRAVRAAGTQAAGTQ